MCVRDMHKYSKENITQNPNQKINKNIHGVNYVKLIVVKIHVMKNKIIQKTKRARYTKTNEKTKQKMK